MRVRQSKRNLPQKLDLILPGKKLLQLAAQWQSFVVDHEDNLEPFNALSEAPGVKNALH
ncbi:MAG TPA: hypothetical protein VIT91_05755 [Chthoniobacterales bacterium]